MTSRWQGKRVGVLMGGISSEREVSLKTGQGVLEALASRGYEAVAIDWDHGTSLPSLLGEARVAIVWNALHGTYGEDGAVQGLLRCMGIACTGADILSSALAMDKIASKGAFEAASVPTPKWQLWQDGHERRINLPLVVKPAREGSSVGVSLVYEESQIEEALAKAAPFGDILLEEYIPGHEVFVGILGEEALGTIEVRTKAGFYDYEAKYLRDDTEYLIPATLPDDLNEKIMAVGLAAHRAVGCHPYSRVDIRVRDDGACYVLEVNSLPGMTSSSLMPKLATRCGISYDELCVRILEATEPCPLPTPL